MVLEEIEKLNKKIDGLIADIVGTVKEPGVMGMVRDHEIRIKRMEYNPRSLREWVQWGITVVLFIVAMITFYNARGVENENTNNPANNRGLRGDKDKGLIYDTFVRNSINRSVDLPGCHWHIVD